MKPNTYAGTLLLQHPLYDRDGYEKGDKSFKESCCHYSVMQANGKHCDAFTQRRPINDGTGYAAPVLGELYSHLVYNNDK